MNKTKLSDYAIGILSFMNNDKKYHLDDFSFTGLGLPTVKKVLFKLKKNAIIKTSFGIHGGYELAKSKEEINIWEVVVSVDGLSSWGKCGSSCYINHLCSWKNHIANLECIEKQLFEKIFIADISKKINIKVEKNDQ